jgi:hypothetical protein
MFKGLGKKRDRVNRARRVVNFFANHKLLKSHGRKIGLIEIDKNLKGLMRVKKLDDDVVLYNGVMGIYFCLLQTFQRSGAFKVIMNSRGKRYIRQVQIPIPPQQIPIPQP